MLSVPPFQPINSAGSKFYLSGLHLCARAALNLSLFRRFFYYYRDIAGAIYPVLEDVQGFENHIELLLRNRLASGGMYRDDVDEAQTPFGVSIAFLGLLYAVLASGCQSSGLGSKERELTSQVYGMPEPIDC